MLNKDSSTARGLINPDSTLKYGELIEHFIKFKNNFGNKPFNTNEKFNHYSGIGNRWLPITTNLNREVRVHCSKSGLHQVVD